MLITNKQTNLKEKRMLSSIILSMAMSASPAPIQDIQNLDIENVDKKRGTLRIDKKRGTLRIDKKRGTLRIDKKRGTLRIDKKRGTLRI